MRRIHARFALLLISFLVLSFHSETHAQILPTKLTVTVIDGLGNYVEGAQVFLYTNEDDYRASENAAFEATTDKKGRAKFKEIDAVAYYIEAKKDEMNNNGEGVKTGKLSAGRINKVNTVIE